MNKDNLDNIFRSGLDNYESKSDFDSEALWSKVNESILQKRSPSFFKNPWIYGGTTAIGMFSILALLYFSHKTVQQKPKIQSKSHEIPVLKNEIVQKPVNNDTSAIINKPNSKPIQLCSKAKIEPPKPTNVNIENSGSTNSETGQTSIKSEIQTSSAEEIIETSTGQTTTIKKDTNANVQKSQPKKITVVKKQITHTDTLVNVRRLRK